MVRADVIEAGNFAHYRRSKQFAAPYTNCDFAGALSFYYFKGSFVHSLPTFPADILHSRPHYLAFQVLSWTVSPYIYLHKRIYFPLCSSDQ